MDRRRVENFRTQVLVVGGGAAGVAAAVTAARQGLEVTLVERYGFCGGGAVAGMSGTMCGLYMATRQRGAAPEQVVHGFASEFATALEQGGGLGPPVRYGLTWTRVHDPLIWRETADALLRGAGVRVILHGLAIEVLGDGQGHTSGAVIATKQGRINIEAQVVVDASGDADLAAMAGLPTNIGRDGTVQNPTMIFRLGNVDVKRFIAVFGDDAIMPQSISDAIANAEASGAFNLPRKKIFVFPTTRPGELLCNCTRVVGADGRELMTLNARDFTEAEFEGRMQVREYARFFRERVAGCENSFVVDTGVQVGVRQTRQIGGVKTLTNDDVTGARKCADAIARCPWPIELHSGGKPKLDWLLDDYYEVPFDVLKPAQSEGLLVAGRCLSAEHEAMASARVTAQCFSYGHAVGHAAVLAVRESIPTSHLAGTDVRQRLNADGARLH